MQKIITAQEAARLIQDNDTIGFSGFAAGAGFAEDICCKLEERFLKTGKPENLTVLIASGNGDGTERPFALNHFAYEKMLGRVISGHVGLSKKFSALIAQDKVPAWNFPQGVVTHLFRAIAGGKPGVLTHVGLETFADPRVEGGKMNPSAQENLVDVIDINGEEKLLYRSIPVNVALIRGTTADEFGNLTMEHEALLTEALPVAQAAKNSGGIVIAQVQRIAKRGSLNPMEVKVPGILVDYIVVAPPEHHRMNALVDYNPAYSGEIRVPLDAIMPMEMDLRKIIAKRCAMELRPHQVINLGIGVPDGVAGIALEEGISEQIYMTIESGVIGGVPGPGLHIGASANPEAIIPHQCSFDFYDGGGLDLAYLGLAQADREGNINVSKFGGRMVGCGGFINITQNAKKVVFCGTFTAGKSQIEITDQGLNIVKDGGSIKFIEQVEQITFSGKYARRTGQPVLTGGKHMGSVALSGIGVILALVALSYLCYKSVSPVIVGLLASAIVALTSGIPILEGILQKYVPGVGSFFVSYFVIFFLSALLGKIYEHTGAAKTIAENLARLFGAKLAMLAVCLTTAVLIYGGITSFVVIFAIYPIALILFEKADIPDRLIPGIVCLGLWSFAMTGPASTQIQNIMPMQYFGTHSLAGGIPGWVGAASMLVLGVGYMMWEEKRARRSGEHFEFPGHVERYADDKHKPPLLIALIKAPTPAPFPRCVFFPSFPFRHAKHFSWRTPRRPADRSAGRCLAALRTKAEQKERRAVCAALFLSFVWPPSSTPPPSSASEPWSRPFPAFKS